VVILELRGFKDINKGDTYEIRGYESAEFSGPVIDDSDPSQEVPQQPFQYHPLFTVQGPVKIIPQFVKPSKQQ
jgi:hypothetical protein